MKNNKINDLEKQERLKRAKNKMLLMRKQINQSQSNRARLLALVREYVSQRPEVAVKIVNNWLKH